MVICNLFYACRCFILSFDLQVYGDIHVYPIKPKYIQHNSNIWIMNRNTFFLSLDWTNIQKRKLNNLFCIFFSQRKFEDTKVVSRSLKSKIGRQCNDQKINKDLQNSTQKSKNWETRIPLKTGMNSGMVHVSKLFYSCHTKKRIRVL